MHGRCIVHQDIKPSNVLVYSLPAYTIDVASMHLIYVQVTKTYSANVCDLGVARIHDWKACNWTLDEAFLCQLAYD